MSIKVKPNSFVKALKQDRYNACGFIGNKKYVEYVKNPCGYERTKVRYLKNKNQYSKDILTFERVRRDVFFKKDTTANEIRTKNSPFKEAVTYLINGIKKKRVTYDKLTNVKNIQHFNENGLPVIK